jgi:uncharacterized phiE125 gp8 family phage protein
MSERYYTPVRTVDPTQEPITVAEAKQHCRALADVPDEDRMMADYVRAARDAYEAYTERAAMTQTWRWTLDNFCDEMVLPMAAPLQSVTSVKYYDTAGTQQTLATTYYRVDTDSTPGIVRLKPDQAWPDVQTTRGQAVEIVYVCGHASVAAVPQSVKSGMYFLIDHLYENRGAVQTGIGIGAVELPLGMAWFWAPLKLWAA